MSHSTISIAIPAFNEAENLDLLWQRLTDVFSELADRYQFEVVVCENGSEDSSYDILQRIASVDSRLKIVQLSRNFHMEGGVLAALSRVTGEACIVMSADLQDPPEMIPTMLEMWEAGYEHVYTVITHRHGESLFRRVSAELFYRILDRVSDYPIPRNASDFRLVDRRMYGAFNDLPEKDRMIRSTWAWLGFRSTSIPYERPARTGGRSSFNPFVTGAYAIRGIFATSLKPLKILPIVGFFLSALSFIGLFLSAVRAVWSGVPAPGFGTITSLLLLLFGVLFLLLAVLAEYVGMIYIETRGRPAFIIRSEQPRVDETG